MSSNITIEIKGENSSDVEIIGRVLQSFQKTIYNIAQSDNLTIPKKGSNLSKELKKKYSLKIEEVRSGSFHAKMLMEETEADKVISKTDMLINAIQKEDEPSIEELLKNPQLRNQTLGSFIRMWSTRTAMTSIKTNGSSVSLDPAKRKFIKRYIYASKYRKFEDKFFVGRLIGLEIENTKRFRIDSTEGIYFVETPESSEEEFITKIKEHIGHIVRIEGRFAIGVTKLKLDNIATLNIQGDYSATEMIFARKGKELIKLKHPVKFEINYDKEKEKFVVENDDLGIFSIESNLHIAYSSVLEQFNELLIQYAYESDSKLTKDAQEFKNKLKKFIGD